MDPTLKLITEIGTGLASPVVFAAAIRFLIVLGRWSAALERFAQFIDTATTRLDSHGERIAALEGAHDAQPRPIGAPFDRRSSV